MPLWLDLILAPLAAVLIVSMASLLVDATKPHSNTRNCRDLYKTFHP